MQVAWRVSIDFAACAPFPSQSRLKVIDSAGSSAAASIPAEVASTRRVGCFAAVGRS